MKARTEEKRRRTPRDDSPPAPHSPAPAFPSPTLDVVLRWSAAFFLVGSGVIHGAEIEVHAAAWAVSGMFFLGMEMTQICLAIAVVAFRSRFVYRAAIVTSLGIVAIWGVSRTVGIPFGPDAWVPVPTGRPDVLSTLLELGTAVALLPLALARPDRVTVARSGDARMGVWAYPSIAGFGGVALLAAILGAPGHTALPGGSVTSPAVEAAAQASDTGDGLQSSVARDQAGPQEPTGKVPAIDLSARRSAFLPGTLTLPAGKEVRILFQNQDREFHNLTITRAIGVAPLFTGRLVIGGTTTTYEVKPLSAGSYIAICDLHPSMTGKLIVRWGVQPPESDLGAQAGDAADLPSLTTGVLTRARTA